LGIERHARELCAIQDTVEEARLGKANDGQNRKWSVSVNAEEQIDAANDDTPNDTFET